MLMHAGACAQGATAPTDLVTAKFTVIRGNRLAGDKLRRLASNLLGARPHEEGDKVFASGAGVNETRLEGPLYCIARCGQPQHFGILAEYANPRSIKRILCERGRS
jgi:hypothetical protein